MFGLKKNKKAENNIVENNENIKDTKEESADERRERKLRDVEKNKINKKHIEGTINEIRNLFSNNNATFLSYRRGTISKEEFREYLEDCANVIIEKNQFSCSSEEVADTYFKNIEGYDIIDEIIDLFVKDNEVGDIKIYDYNRITYQKRGKLYDWTKTKFEDRDEYISFASRLANKNDSNLAKINAIQFFLDDKSRDDVNVRVNITTEINDSKVPFIAMRVEPVRKYSREQLLEQGFYTEEVDEFLMNEINKNLSFFWVGATGSGKTTGINHYIDRLEWDRPETTLVVQKISELHSNNPHMIFQHEVKSNGDNRVNFTVRDITENAFQLGIQRIIIGELVGAEALEMINVVYGGTPGWASGHGAGTRDGIEKWVHNAKINSDYKREDLLRMVSKVNYVIYMDNFKILNIDRIDGYDEDKKDLIFTSVVKDGQLVK